MNMVKSLKNASKVFKCYSKKAKNIKWLSYFGKCSLLIDLKLKKLQEMSWIEL